MRKITPRNLDELKSILTEKQLVLFGAGRAMRGLFTLFDGETFLNNIAYVVDNNKILHDTSVQICGQIIQIKSPKWLESHILENTIVIVTNCLNPEILSQLESMPQLKDTLVFLWSELRMLFYDNQVANVKLPETFRVYKEQKIPKVIHYCWFGRNAIPNQYKEWMASWKKYCPDYEIVEWNESNYDYKKHPYMEQAYKAEKWAFVTDYARLDIVYQNGGLYFDTDVELLKNMDDFLYQDGFGGFQPDRRFASGLGIGARKKLPVLKEFMDLYDGKEFVDFKTKSERWAKKIEVTPDILTAYTNKKGGAYTNGIVDVDGFRIYPAPVLCGLIGQKFYITQNTYAIHHFSASWLPKA